MSRYSILLKNTTRAVSFAASILLASCLSGNRKESGQVANPPLESPLIISVVPGGAYLIEAKPYDKLGLCRELESRFASEHVAGVRLENADTIGEMLPVVIIASWYGVHFDYRVDSKFKTAYVPQDNKSPAPPDCLELAKSVETKH